MAEQARSGRRTALLGLAAGGASALAAAVVGGRPAQAIEPRLVNAEDMWDKTLRVYHTGDVITMDYSEDRVNIELGPDDRIVKVSIG
jgi:hypothetical protein